MYNFRFLLLTDGSASVYYVFSRALTGFSTILIVLRHSSPLTLLGSCFSSGLYLFVFLIFPASALVGHVP